MECVAANNVVREKARKSDVLIWNEASMSSARMFDLVNTLHHHLSMDSCKERLPFAGKQIIIVGEFFQLRPVPNLFDAGDFMFRSRVFGCAITHRLQLTKVIRQSEADKQFLAALKDIRLGLRHNGTTAFIVNLKCDLPLDANDNAVHILFKRNSALVHNRSVLQLLPGGMECFEATYEGHGDTIKWPGERTLLLKSGCKVMLLWNKSKDLKKGSMGTFKGVCKDGEKLEVWIPCVGTVMVGREKWMQRNRRQARGKTLRVSKTKT